MVSFSYFYTPCITQTSSAASFQTVDLGLPNGAAGTGVGTGGSALDWILPRGLGFMMHPTIPILIVARFLLQFLFVNCLIVITLKWILMAYQDKLCDFTSWIAAHQLPTTSQHSIYKAAASPKHNMIRPVIACTHKSMCDTCSNDKKILFASYYDGWSLLYFCEPDIFPWRNRVSYSLNFTKK